MSCSVNQALVCRPVYREPCIDDDIDMQTSLPVPIPVRRVAAKGGGSVSGVGRRADGGRVREKWNEERTVASGAQRGRSRSVLGGYNV